MKKGKVQLKISEESKTLQEVIDEWLLHCKVNNFSEYTINHYKHQLHCFNLFCDFEQPVLVLTKELFEEYILYCQNKKISNVTVVTYTKVIRTLYYWCMDKGYISNFQIRLPKFEKPLKETYTNEEISTLLKKPNIRKTSFAEYRTWVMINYVLATGNRMNTIANLKIEDLDFDNNLIKLTTTKNKKAQMIPMVDALKKVLIEYLSIRKGKSIDYLFCTVYGNQMGKTAITQSLINYNKNRGVSKTSLHLFRHTFAKNYLLAGGDIFRLQRLLGHSNLNITKEYLDLVVDDLKQNYDKFNPLSNANIKNHIKMK